MTTSVVIASPYNATRGVVVQVQTAGKTTDTFKVAPGETGKTLHIDDDQIVMIEQDKDSKPGQAAPKSR
jgi:hypothetical protein